MKPSGTSIRRAPAVTSASTTHLVEPRRCRSRGRRVGAAARRAATSGGIVTVISDASAQSLAALLCPDEDQAHDDDDPREPRGEGRAVSDLELLEEGGVGVVRGDVRRVVRAAAGQCVDRTEDLEG